MARILAAFGIIVALGGGAHSQELDARGLARLVAPYVNEGTQAVGHVHVEKVNVKRYFDMAHAFGPTEKEIAAARAFAEQQQAKLLKAGIHHVLALVNVSDWKGLTPPEVVLVAPFTKKDETGDLIKVIELLPGFTAKIDNNALLVRFGGTNPAQPSDRPEFLEGLEALKGKPIQLIASPSAELRQLVEQFMPNLPPALGGGPINLLSRGIRWIGVGYDTETLAQEYLIQAKDVPAAKELRALADTALEATLKAQQFADSARLREMLEFKQQGDRVTLRVSEKTLTAMLTPALAKVRMAAARSQSQNHLKQIGLAMHSHHDVNKRLPARASVDKNGKPLLSWRVHVLPLIDQNELYQQFKLDEPWDSPHNKKLVARIPPMYVSPQSKAGGDGKTTYLAITGKDSAFESAKGTRFAEMTDGLSNTIMVVEANDTRAVYWTQPEDFPIDTKDPLSGLVLPELKGFQALFGDGSVRFVSASIAPATLQALFTRNGGEVVNLD